MADKLKTGIIGCGKVGHFHAECYCKSPYSEFTGVYSRNYDKARAFAAKYGVKVYRSIEEMAEDGCQVVSICSPHPQHRDNAVQAANCGMHIMVEKPLADSLQGCDDIISAAKKAGVKGSTVSQRRFYEPVKRIRNAIDTGKIGVPILGTVSMYSWRDMDYYNSDPWRGTWKGEGGGVLVNQAPHQFDLLLWFMGDIDELYGIWDTLNHPQLEVDDTALALIRFRSGALGSIVVSNSQNPPLYANVHIHGSNGASIGVQTDGGSMFIAGMSNITEPPVLDLWNVPGEADRLSQYIEEDKKAFLELKENCMYYYHLQQINDFLSSIIHNRQPLVTLEDGRKTVELFTAIYRSNRDRMPIRFPLTAENRQDYDGRLL